MDGQDTHAPEIIGDMRVTIKAAGAYAILSVRGVINIAAPKRVLLWTQIGTGTHALPVNIQLMNIPAWTLMPSPGETQKPSLPLT